MDFPAETDMTECLEREETLDQMVIKYFKRIKQNDPINKVFNFQDSRVSLDKVSTSKGLKARLDYQVRQVITVFLVLTDKMDLMD